MKKYLLATMMLVGALSAYGQGNRIIVPVENKGATASVPVEVTGEVFDPAVLSLVVELKSSQSADGTGFSFKMPHMWKGAEDVIVVTGAYTVTVEKDGAKVPMGTLDVKLNDGVNNDETISNKKPGGTASDVTLNYAVTGAMNTPKTQYDGTLRVDAKAGNKTGEFSDTTVNMVVQLSGQEQSGPAGR